MGFLRGVSSEPCFASPQGEVKAGREGQKWRGSSEVGQEGTGLEPVLCEALEGLV